jgi:DNA-directed RNA polymerase specialized sigma subunit
MARRRRKSNHYFTKDHENAIIQYALTEDNKIRTKLYANFIGPAFDEMVDKIVYTYKFTNLPNIDDLRAECKIWLTTILDKYDSSKGSKAFSYFSVITKNWFIHKIKKNTNKIKREVQLEDTHINDHSNSKLVAYNDYYQKRNEKEFWQLLHSEIKDWEGENLKANERKVLEAIKILFENSEDIEIFNKKAIYLYLREITGLNTKQVVNNLNKIRIRYRGFKKEWNKN